MFWLAVYAVGVLVTAWCCGHWELFDHEDLFFAVLVWPLLWPVIAIVAVYEWGATK